MSWPLTLMVGALVVVIIAGICAVCWVFKPPPPPMTFYGPWHTSTQKTRPTTGKTTTSTNARQRGIVMAAGGVYTPLALKSLAVLRKLGCTLPATVVHADANELPADSSWRTIGEELQCTFIDATQAFKARFPALPVPNMRGYQLKPFAVLFADYAQTMLLDADTLFVRDPTSLFDDPLFRSTGALFWPDVVDDEWTRYLKPTFWNYVGVPTPPPGPQHESSCVLLDRTRHAQSLGFVCDLNYTHNETYQLAHGDKDTWRAGCLKAGVPFSLVPVAPGALISRDSKKNFVQHDPRGEPLYVQGEDLRIKNMVFDGFVRNASVHISENERAARGRPAGAIPDSVVNALSLAHTLSFH
jgi:hypothetical protein